MPTIDFQKLLFTRHRLKKPAVIVATLILIALGFEKIPLLDEPITGTVSVIDGDTIEIHGQRFRFYGIDAPESSQTCRKDGNIYFCGKEAAAALAQVIGQKPVTCEKKDTDAYHRIVAICTAGEMELNRWMVKNGYALAYRQYSDRYILDEMRAKTARLGLWAGPFQKPWVYRQESHERRF